MSLRLIYFFFLFTPGLFAQTVEVVKISVSGNKKTKEKIIQREITFKAGDKIDAAQLAKIIERSRQNIQNTGLFVKTVVDTTFFEQQVSVNFIVSETWYIYPYVIFELADRNFNVWWKEQNRSLDRVNFGLRLVHLNLTGHRDKLKLTVQDGYTKKYEIDYFFPGINQAQTLGLFTNIFFARAKETAYITEQNKLLFYNFEDAFQLRRFRTVVGLSYRPGFYTFQTLKLQYSDNDISDDIAFDLNPEYFLNNKNRQRHFTLEYNFTYDNRDIKPYPLNGQLFSATLQKDGFGLTKDVNALKAVFTYKHYFSFNKKISLGLIGSTKVNILRHKQPYTHVSSLGYDENILAGYELYVVDGMDHIYAKSALRYELINNELDWGKLMFIRQFRQMPYKLYFVVNNDTGFVNAPFYNHYGMFNNQVLWGGGVGLHLVLYFDKVIKIEYHINKFGERGLFLNFDFSI